MLVLLADVLTETVLGLFDHTGLTYTDQLNAAGSATVQLPLTDWWRERVAIDGAGAAKTFVYLVDEAGLVPWWGFVWGSQVDVDRRSVTLGCAGIHSVLAGFRTKRSDSSWAGADQATIAGDLIDEAQTGTNRDLYIDTGGLAATGITRSWTIEGDDRKSYGRLIEQLASLEDGFDFRYDAVWAGGGTRPAHSFALLYPAPRTTPVVTLICTGQIALRSYNVDGTAVRSDFDVVGNQEAVTRSQTLAAYPDLDGSVSRSQETNTDGLLDSWGDRALAASTDPLATATVVALVGDDEAPPCAVGDAVRLVETDVVGLDSTFVVAQSSTALGGAGRIITYNLVEPSTLVRTAALDPGEALAGEMTNMAHRLDDLERRT